MSNFHYLIISREIYNKLREDISRSIVCRRTLICRKQLKCQGNPRFTGKEEKLLFKIYEPSPSRASLRSTHLIFLIYRVFSFIVTKVVKYFPT